MTRLLSMCAFVLWMAEPVFAQELPATVPEETATATAATVGNESYRTREDVTVTANLKAIESRRVNDKTFWAVGGLLGTAMALDTKSTFDVLGRCAGCYEANPYVAPFVSRGPAVTMSAGVAFDVGVMALAAQMKRSPEARFHRIWWVIPIALTAGHVIAYRHNLRVGQ